MEVRVMGKYVNEKVVKQAIETAYESLPENERAEIEAFVEQATLIKNRPRNFGGASIHEFIAKLGLFLAENPEVEIRLDEDGSFETFVKSAPVRPVREKQMRSFLL